MTAAHAEAIARGEEPVDSAHDILKEYDHEHKEKASQPISQDRGVGVQSEPDGVPRAGEDVRNAGESRRSRVADQSPATDNPDKEEAMWKEKYEALKRDFDRMVEETGRQVLIDLKHGVNPKDVGKVDTNLEHIYAYGKKGAESDPGILQTLAAHPEIRVKTERPVITVEANGSLFGRICQLTAEGFFKQSQPTKVVTAEA